MKIMFQQNTTSGPFYLRMGYARVLESIGCKVYHWFSERESCFDAFDRVGNIDLFVGQTYSLSRALVKNILARPKMQVILQSSTWGKVTENLDLTKYPILVPNEQEKNIVGELQAKTGQIKFVFLNYHQNRIEDTLGGWRTLGVDIHGSPCAADTFVFMGGKHKPEYDTDIVFIGGRWEYKAKNLDKYIIPLCNENTAPKINGKKVRIQIWGNGGWQGTAQYLGMAPESEILHIFSSAKICLNVSEPHSTTYGYDIVERPFKTALSGNLVLSDYVESMHRDVFFDRISYYKDYDELKSQIIYYLTHEQERLEKGASCRELILEKHTYFDRVADMFKKLNMDDWATKVVVKKRELLNA